MPSSKPKPGKSLAETHPELAAQLVDLDPKSVTAGSSQKVGWKCKQGHQWNATVKDRKDGDGCPVCAGKKVSIGFNDLATVNPVLSAEADGWDPKSVTAGSNQKVGWKCKQGHQWNATVKNRSNGAGCPVCAGQVVQIGFNDLATINPDLALQANGWDPTTVTANSSRRVGWECSVGHKWDAVVASRFAGSGCPVCAGKEVQVGFNDLATINPELAAQADGWDPTTLTPKSGKKVGWKCSFGHKWKAVVYGRSNGSGCPICAGQVVQIGVNDLLTAKPELAAQADSWDPRLATKGSNKKVSWKCSFGHKWSASVKSRSNGTGCPVCAGRVVQIGFNDLATINPELAAQADGWDPTTLTPKSGKKVGWTCSFGHKWKAVLSNRSSGSGCPICANDVVLAGYNDLLTLHPDIALEADGWDPNSVTAGSKKLVQWKCKLGHAFKARIYSRVGNDNKKGSSCPFCFGSKVLTGFNDLSTVNPDLAAEAFGWDPSVYSKGSNARKKWICKEKHVWTASIHDRNSGSGCPSCAKGGFDPNQPGFLYFIDHFELQMFQIGITNFPKDRLGDHTRRGWQVIEVRGPMDGHLTQQLETACLRVLEKRGAQLGHKTGIAKFDGYSEAWAKSSLNVTSIKQILDWVYEDESISIKGGHT